MSKFKKGDRVRVKRECTGCVPGEVYILHDEWANGGPLHSGDLVAWNEDTRKERRGGCSCENNWELITDEQPKFKVGDRVLGKPGRYDSQHRGTVGKVTRGNDPDGWYRVRWASGHCNTYRESDLMFVEEGSYTVTADKDYKAGEVVIKKTKMQQLTTMMKKLLDADTQVLVRMGYLDSELDLTSKTKGALDVLAFEQHKKDLVELAKAEEKELKAAKK